jgi:protein-disulfide isomerase
MENKVENSEIDSRWVDDRMAVLKPAAEWSPNAGRGLAQVRNGAQKKVRRQWAWTAATASASLFVVLALSASQSCAWGACLLPGAASFLPAAVVGEQASFKTEGAAAAPITLEIYSDYECPFCAKFFEESMPLLQSQYVQPGKIRLVHRDFPLPQHPYSKLAARYANAAGELGHYDTAVRQIFRTQEAWSKDGNVDAQLLAVLPPGVMQKVREKVNHDARLDDSVTADLGMVGKDRVNMTPTLVIATKEGRRTFAPAPSFAILKAYLDQLLAK